MELDVLNGSVERLFLERTDFIISIHLFTVLTFCFCSQHRLNNSNSKPRSSFCSFCDINSIVFSLPISSSFNPFSPSVWSFKLNLTTHLFWNFCLICLDRCVSTVDLPIPAVSEISINLRRSAFPNNLSKPSAVCVCVNCRYQHSVSKLPCCQSFLTCLPVANEYPLFDPVDTICPTVSQCQPVNQIIFVFLYHLICLYNICLVSNFCIDIVLFIVVITVINRYSYITNRRKFSSP